MVKLILNGAVTIFLGMMIGERIEGTFVVKSGLAQMCKGGLIMDVVNAEQARIAEEAGVSSLNLACY